jgi:hypothetical protein
MGLLDEAIKEHLELKRRHGADPSEVARLEHEALGPARREPAVADAPVAEEPVAEEEVAEPSFVDDDYADEVTADERLDAPVRRVEPEPEPEPDTDPPAEVDQPTAQYSLEELEEAADEPEPEPDRTEPPADVVPADEEPDGDDVLEETPEFLQETPEHDRLWFEQKPPRDFDF